MRPVRYLGRNVTGKSHGSPEMFSTSEMRGEISRRSGILQMGQKNIGKQTRGILSQTCQGINIHVLYYIAFLRIFFRVLTYDKFMSFI